MCQSHFHAIGTGHRKPTSHHEDWDTVGLTNTRTGTQWAWYAVDLVTQWASYTVDLVTQWTWSSLHSGPGYTVDLVLVTQWTWSWLHSGSGTQWTRWSWLHSGPGTQWSWSWLHSGPGPGYTGDLVHNGARPGYTVDLVTKVGHIEPIPLPLPSQNGHWDKYVLLFTASVSVALA